MRFLFVLLLLAFASRAEAQMDLRLQPTLVPADSEHMATVRRTLRLLEARAERCANQYTGDRTGRVALLIQLDFGSEGRLSSHSVREGAEAIDDELGDCLSRSFRFSRLVPGLTRVSFALTYTSPNPPEPTAAERAQAALEEANHARAFGRCYLDAGNRLRAASRALRRASNDAERARAVRRIERAQVALGQCTLMGTIGSAPTGGLQAPVTSCPGCRSDGGPTRQTAD